jgi:hypothetical protein
MVESYRKDGLKAMASEEDSGKLFGLLADNAQRPAAALPAYSMKLVATLGGSRARCPTAAKSPALLRQKK